MRALTIRRPWASLIICGEKDVENRTWTTRYRGVFAIHAGHRFDQNLQPWQRSIVAKVDAFPRGPIIGVVELMDIVRDSTSRWAEPTCYHWVLANPARSSRSRCAVSSAFGRPRSAYPPSRRLMATEGSLGTSALHRALAKRTEWEVA